MTIEPAKSEVWNIKYDFDYDPDDAGDNFMPHLLFLVHFLGQTLLLTGFFLLSMPFRRKLSVLSTYSHIFCVHLSLPILTKNLCYLAFRRPADEDHSCS